MPVLVNPHTGKTVDAAGASVAVLLAAGFTELKPVEVEKPKTGRSKK